MNDHGYSITAFRPMYLAAILLASLALPAFALGPLGNGGFEAQTGTGEAKSVDGWFEFSLTGYDD